MDGAEYRIDMNDYMTPEQRLLPLESKHERSDRIFNRGLSVCAAYFFGHFVYAVLVGAI